jgi:hypothetical protein
MRSYSMQTITDTPVVTTAETVVATLSGVATNQPGARIGLSGQLTITTGAATTAVTLRIREDSVTGTVVGEATPDSVESAAGGTETHDIFGLHNAAGEYGSKTFVLTVEQTAATANGSVLQASLVADVTP